MIAPSILNIAEICVQHGIQHAVLSPGSRSVPLATAFLYHTAIQTKTINDERSAAFIALGIAQATHMPVVLVCTSGSAVYNYAPAIVEAYYQHIPLLILTADRPPEWIDQLDGQTIRQMEIYGKHVKASFNFPLDYQHVDTQWYIERTIQEAVHISQNSTKGPVHINIPLRAPFYPEKNEKIQFNTNIKHISKVDANATLSESSWEMLMDILNEYDNVLILIGQQRLNHTLLKILRLCTEQLHIPIVGDITANIHAHDQAILQSEFICMPGRNRNAYTVLKPSLLLTFGHSILSKKLKQFIKNYPPESHWHIDESGVVVDTFQALTKIIPVNALYFLQNMHQRKILYTPSTIQSIFLAHWKKAADHCKKVLEDVIHTLPFSELVAMKWVMHYLPNYRKLHIGNSMPIRYANYIGLCHKKDHVEIFANRGTNGIEGTSSTAVGAALVSQQQVVLITGDIAFFYDHNAFWHQYPLHNLRIILLNNHAGGIFTLLNDVAPHPPLAAHFEGGQPLKGKYTAQVFDMLYDHCTTLTTLKKKLAHFFDENDRCKLLEIQTNTIDNQKSYQNFFQKF